MANLQNLNMNPFSEDVQAHYHSPGLFERIIDQLRASGVPLDQVKRSDIAGVDEFHVRGAEVSQELAAAVDIHHKKVLDVGCGIDGPARMLADIYNCQVTGIDLNKEFIRTATKLSELVGLETRTHFIQADATQLPFTSQEFDVVWTQHVQMNIQEKKTFYSEIHRVLSGQGIFLYYDIFRKGSGSLQYPMPWADKPEISFLAEEGEIAILLNTLGFKKIQTKDQTAAGIQFFETLLNTIQASGPPKIGLNLLMGTTTRTKLSNLLEGLTTGNLMLQSGVYSPAS